MSSRGLNNEPKGERDKDAETRDWGCYLSNVIEKFQAGRVDDVPVAIGFLEKIDEAVDHVIRNQQSIIELVLDIQASLEEFQRNYKIERSGRKGVARYCSSFPGHRIKTMSYMSMDKDLLRRIFLSSVFKRWPNLLKRWQEIIEVLNRKGWHPTRIIIVLQISSQRADVDGSFEVDASRKQMTKQIQVLSKQVHKVRYINSMILIVSIAVIRFDANTYF